MKRLNVLDWVAVILVIIGALNWGLVGLFSWSLVGAIFGHMGIITRIIYVIVGIAGLYMIYLLKKHCCCKSGTCTTNVPPQQPPQQ